MSVTTYTRTEPALRPRPATPIAATKGIPSQTGVWVAVSAIAMSFAALTSALVVRQGSGADWQRFALPRILYLDTLILIASSYTLELGRKRFAAATLLRSGPGSHATGDDAVDQAAALRSSGLYWINL